MPNLQSFYGGPVLYSSEFDVGEVTQHDAIHVDGGEVIIDAGDVDGTIDG